ncbi:hypothetical protein CLG94_10920 [Candidatus Methylomirabilis limnetica]|uniref:DUF721 domain-containing protein n=1 Tax=Candidatus Methylomirabilis limnetica TaxID=2033718 RepID=A0A2T4TVV6_9BACT|nr:DUF721 domain-containing protein [Candidatus Methylomirabilis limnetica]PTL35208.1 hypothetical protein CLG94_10920 [Candidatus Methylomirabilis limnetica]
MKTNRPVQRRAQTAPAKCADIIEGSLQGLGLGRVIHHLALLRAWDRAVASHIKERASVEDFRGGRLYLCVEDPIWLHELHMLRHTLKTILNKEVGEPAVGEIVLRIGQIRRCAPVTPSSRGGHRARAVPPAVEASMAKLLSPLMGLPCGDAMQRFFQRWARSE